jgi:hypothetical protein
VQAGETAGSNDQVQTLPSGRQVWIGHQLPDDRRRRELQFANCSAGIPGFCLAHAGKQHILKEMPCESNATCQAECCSQCIANEQCVVWTVNTKLDKCFLRDAAGPRNEGAECTSGLVRSWTPPPPAPPRTPGPVSVNTACWMGPQYPNGTVSPACNSTMHCPTGCLFDLETGKWWPRPLSTVFTRFACHPLTPSAHRSRRAHQRGSSQPSHLDEARHAAERAVSHRVQPAACWRRQGQSCEHGSRTRWLLGALRVPLNDSRHTYIHVKRKDVIFTHTLGYCASIGHISRDLY